MSRALLKNPANVAKLRLLHHEADLREAVAFQRKTGEAINLVPTMGALHAGHLALIDRAKADGGKIIVTIFVNPRQFSEQEDFTHYPRMLEKDAALLEKAGVDYLFAPGIEDIYPSGFATEVRVESLARHLCGSFRPGHFAGVATIVTKLFLMCLPDRAYFGEKDFQQLQIIRRLARDLNMPIAIVGVPTQRDKDGLALSSRNMQLDGQQRKIAGLLPRLMQETAASLADGRKAAPLLAEARQALLTGGFDSIDYFDLCSSQSLEPIAHADGPCRLFAALWLGRTRLIDNWSVLD